MIRVFTTGVFDLFHVGHLKALRKARALGDRLIVGIHNDADTETYKRRPVIPFAHRIEIVGAIDCVDEIIECKPVVPKSLYEEYGIDIHCQGDDVGDCYVDGKQLGIMRFVGRYECIDTTAIINQFLKRFG